MADKKNGSPTALQIIASIITLMGGIFTLLNFLLPTSLVQPVGALVCGLILTIVWILMGRAKSEIALLTWLGMSVVLIIVYLVVSRPAIVTGKVVNQDNFPSIGLVLVLRDASGVLHEVATDKDGQFEVRNVPEGKYTISVSEGEQLLFSGEIPSGWKRIFGREECIGILVQAPTVPSTPSPTPTLRPTYTPTVTPTFTPSATPTFTPTSTSTPLPIPPLLEIFSQVDSGQEFAFTNFGGSLTHKFVADKNCTHSGSYGLRLTYNMKGAGNGGWGVHWDDAPDKHFNASEFSAFTFWVRGASGGETFQIGFKDTSGKEAKVETTSLVVVTSDWKMVKIQLSEFKDLNTASIRNISFGFNKDHGVGSICIDDIAFVP